MNEPVNVYISLCCGVQASKPACVKVKIAPKKKKGGDKAPTFSTLGHWSCGQCGKACKVSVSVRPPKEDKSNG